MKKLVNGILGLSLVVSVAVAQDTGERVGECFNKNSSDGWIKSFFLYGSVTDCINKKSDSKKLGFYDISVLERLSNTKIDLSDETDMQCSKISGKCYSWGDRSNHKFVHVNPKFVKWLDKTFVSTNSKILQQIMPNIYQNNHTQTLRRAMKVYAYLNSKNFKNQVNSYQKSLDNNQDMLGYLFQTYENEMKDFYPNDVENSVLDAGFWLRRGMDGSAKDFYSLGMNILKKYDTDWYIQNKATLLVK